MAFALLIIGIILVVSTVRNTQGPSTPTPNLIDLVTGDFTGAGNFVYWIVAILVIGAIGYIKKLKPVSDAFLVLLLIVMVLKKGNPQFNAQGGFFNQFVNAIKGTTATASTAGSTNTTISIPQIGIGGH